MMFFVYFHIEVEDCLYEELESPPAETTLENQAIANIAQIFDAPVERCGRRRTDGALVCSFKTASLTEARKTIYTHGIAEGNDQIACGTDYVIVRDFEDESGNLIWKQATGA